MCCLRDNLPSSNRLGVLEAPSPKSSAGLDSGGVCTRDPLAFLVLIGADIEGRREFVKLSGRPSSSLSPVLAPERKGEGWRGIDVNQTFQRNKKQMHLINKTKAHLV